MFSRFARALVSKECGRGFPKMDECGEGLDVIRHVYAMGFSSVD